MSKKDYELIAKVIRDWNTAIIGMDTVRASIARAFASELVNGNRRFDMPRFLKACGVSDAS